MFHISGEIPRITPFEQGLPLQRSMDGQRWEADPWIVDERWLGVHVADTVQALKRFGLTTIAAGHCTGWRAIASLLNAFGDEVLTPLAVGKRFVF
jgi:7,8-dihydropterin-6-yl-methyl-4-(beta-D-ribofuranosyl)aminobenzene 5'-phosphate synthase